jgi:nucleotide-binding universal stress UspA family protein
MRAIKSALPVLVRANEVKIIMVRRPGDHSPLLRSMKEYLLLHGVSAHEHVVDPGDDAIGNRLVDAALTTKSDLLVMGGYGQHGYWREAIFGGATSYARWHSALPILMVH